MRWRFAVATVVAVTGAVAAIAPTQAQQSPAWTACSGDTTLSDEAIEACTEIIQSGRETKQNLAVAYIGRGTAYGDKGDYDRAIADFTKAIELDPKSAVAYF